MFEAQDLHSQNIFTGKTVKKDDDHHSLSTLVIIGILAFVVGLAFWYITWGSRVATPVEDSSMKSVREEVASMLINAKYSRSPEDTSKVANTLSKSASSATSQDRANMATMLQNY